MATPLPVTDLRVTDFTYRSITIVWDLYVPNIVDGFKIYVGLTPSDFTNVLIRNKYTNLLTLSTYPFGAGFLAPGTVYYVSVSGYILSNESTPTQIQQSTAVLAAPTGFTSPSQTTTSITTNWIKYPDFAFISRLNFLINTFNPPTTNIILLKDDTTETKTGLTPNTRYYINLTAQITQALPNPTYLSPPAILNIVTLANPPTNLLIDAGTTQTSIPISWTNPTPPAQNNLLAISTEDGVFTNSVTLSATDNSYTWTSLVPETVYYFRVQNSNLDGIAGSPIFNTATTLMRRPVDSILFTDITTNGFTANFTYENPEPDEIGYRIGTTNPPTGVYTYVLRTPSLVWTDRAEDTFYFLEVVARYSGEHDSEPLIAGTFTSNATPSNFTPASAPTVNSIIMGWDASPSPTTGYDIWISTVENTFNDPPTTLGIVQMYEFTGLTVATTYFFKIVDLGTGDPSPPAYGVGTTANPPQVTTFYIDAIAFTTADLTWLTPSPTPDSYNFYQTTNSGDYGTPISLTYLETNYSAINLLPNTQYFFKIESVIGSVASAATLTNGLTLPTPPITEFYATNITTTGMELLWNTVFPTPDSNNFYQTTNPSNYGTPTSLPITTEFLILTDLTPGTHYYFKIESVLNGVPSTPILTDATTDSIPPVVNPQNNILYIFKATDGFKHSAHSPQRSIRRPVLRQVRGGW
jgi:hypothetical protein